MSDIPLYPITVQDHDWLVDQTLKLNASGICSASLKLQFDERDGALELRRRRLELHVECQQFLPDVYRRDAVLSDLNETIARLRQADALLQRQEVLLQQARLDEEGFMDETLVRLKRGILVGLDEQPQFNPHTLITSPDYIAPLTLANMSFCDRSERRRRGRIQQLNALVMRENRCSYREPGARILISVEELGLICVRCRRDCMPVPQYIRLEVHEHTLHSDDLTFNDVGFCPSCTIVFYREQVRRFHQMVGNFHHLESTLSTDQPGCGLIHGSYVHMDARVLPITPITGFVEFVDCMEDLGINTLEGDSDSHLDLLFAKDVSVRFLAPLPGLPESTMLSARSSSSGSSSFVDDGARRVFSPTEEPQHRQKLSLCRFNRYLY